MANGSGAAELPSADTSPGPLEEAVFPSLIQPTAVLDPNTLVDPDGRLRIVRHLESRGRVNEYAAEWNDGGGNTVAVELRQAPLDHQGLASEAEILSAVRFAMLPKVYSVFERDAERYLAVGASPSPSLEKALAAGLEPDHALSILLQLAQAVRRVHEAGWAVLAIAPTDVRMGEPIQLARLGFAARLGSTLPGPLHVAGYSAPELAQGGTITGAEDVYMLGAILFHALSGEVLPETGLEVASLPSKVKVPGAPQILVRALAPVESRITLEDLYRELLSLRHRQAAAPLTLEVSSATTVGLNPGRLVNEDSCGYSVWASAGADGQPSHALLCVADGMGGMDAGEVASQSALRSILDAAADWAAAPESIESPATRMDPVNLIEQAAPVVHAAAQGRQTGTTVTCVIVDNAELRLGHIGDTRAYHFRAGALTQLTSDHSLVAAMVNSGVLTSEEARGHPDSNKVLRSLGSQRDLPPGYVDSLEATIGQSSLTLQAGDWLVLCSDGVWGSVTDDAIKVVLAEAIHCSAAARALIARALDAGAPDNATAIVARCMEGSGA